MQYKPFHDTNLKTLKRVYHSRFASHLPHSGQLQGRTNKESQNEIQEMQNQTLRKTSFKKFYDSTAQLLKDLKLLKFCHIVSLQN